MGSCPKSCWTHTLEGYETSRAVQDLGVRGGVHGSLYKGNANTDKGFDPQLENMNEFLPFYGLVPRI